MSYFTILTTFRKASEVVHPASRMNLVAGYDKDYILLCNEYLGIERPLELSPCFSEALFQPIGFFT
jgi:hypothetical protein